MNNKITQTHTLTHSIKTLMAPFLSIIYNKREVYLDTINLMGVHFQNTTMTQAIKTIKENVKAKKKTKLYFINADTLNQTYTKPSLRTILNTSAHVFPDGSGIKLACNILNTPRKENINGTDMFPLICEMAQEEGIKLFLYGAAQGVVDSMKDKVLKKFPKLQIVGCMNGYDYHDNEVINAINHSRADIVFVAKGAPLQEEWINTHASHIVAPVILGVGGLFDFYSENISRAPQWMRSAGIEWTYRLLQEPKRMWKRYILGNPLFLWRAYKWDKKQKNMRMKKYNQLLGSKTVSLLPDLSYFWHRFYPIGKRVLDILATSIALILLSPLILMIALLIKLESRGSILFSHTRVGQNGKHFKMYKFRSMVQDAEARKKDLVNDNESKDGVIFKMKEDPRVTKVGKFIRKWSIDELPQLFNVLNGDMSLVGPRPPVPKEVEEYTSNDLKRLHVVPGITCIWQVSGRSDIPFKQQVELDKKYIHTQSLGQDMKILLSTIPAVLTRKGAY